MLYNDNLYYEINSDESFENLKNDDLNNNGIVKKITIIYAIDNNKQVLKFKKDKNKDETKNIDLNKYKILTKYYITKVNGIFAFDLEDDCAIKVSGIGNFLVSKNDYMVSNKNEKVKEMLKKYDNNYVVTNQINDDEFIYN